MQSTISQILRSIRLPRLKIPQQRIHNLKDHRFFLFGQAGNILQALQDLLVDLQGGLPGQIIQRNLQGGSDLDDNLDRWVDIPSFIPAEHIAGSALDVPRCW